MSQQPIGRVTRFAEIGDVPLHLALVEPEIPPNTGNVARLCAATGCALHLIEPLGFSIDDRALKRAGLDYWHKLMIVVHPSLDAFLTETAERRRWFLSTRATRTYAQAKFLRGDFLVFGRETKGLPQSLLDTQSEHTLRIPMREDSVRSINLSSAVAVVTYSALSFLGFPDLH
ncbi:MAG: tRNA (cytidine(34)-2'-O)-methyltransferase [Vulcanimicrobiaceae bacterium]